MQIRHEFPIEVSPIDPCDPHSALVKFHGRHIGTMISESGGTRFAATPKGGKQTRRFASLLTALAWMAAKSEGVADDF